MTSRGPTLHPHRHPRLRPLALSLACMGLAPALAQTLPTGFAQIAGNVCLAMGGACVPGMTRAPDGATTLNILQSSNRAIAQWNTFGVPFGSAVIVKQPSATSVLLNRVVGGEESRIMGSLTANGHVYLVNPSGVLFGSKSSVNVGGLVASTLDIAGSANDNFKARNDTFMAGGVLNPTTQLMEMPFSGAADSTAGITVEKGARITAGQGEAGTGGLIALMGAKVSNSGTLNVARGTAGLVSGSEVVMVVDPMGDGLTTFRIPSTNKAVTALVENTADGTVMADGGRIQLLANSMTPGDIVVNQRGLLQARSVTAQRNGEILLGQVSETSDTILLGGSVDVSGTAAGMAGGTVRVTADRLRVAGANIDASGSSGGNVTLVGGAATTVSPDTLVRANATSAGGTGGTIAVGGDTLHLSGTLEAKGLGSGNGGNVTLVGGIGGGSLEVGPDTVVDARGGADGGANGTWRVISVLDLHVKNDVPAYQPDAFPVAAPSSSVSASAIGGALGRGTDVTLESWAITRVDGKLQQGGVGIVFDKGAQVVKSEGGSATLTVSSQRNIAMDAGSSIRSDAGALNVDFNADSKGTPPAEVPAIGDANDPVRRDGTITLQDASIATGGGNIRFYGQSDAVNGRAIGAVTVDPSALSGGVTPAAGIGLANSTLSTCAVGPGCAGSGSISLRGQGATIRPTESAVFLSGSGVVIRGGSLTTGAGDITVDGRGGVGSAGVAVTTFSSEATGPLAPTLQSGSGTITLVGSSRSWTAGDPIGNYFGAPTGTETQPAQGGGVGVNLTGANVATGGNVRIDGRGGDVFGMTTAPGNAEFLTRSANAEDAEGNVVGSSFSAGNGTVIASSSVVAGKGRQIDVSGTAGSKGFAIVNDKAGNPVVTPSNADAYAVGVLGTAGKGLAVEGGRLSVDGRGGDVAIVYTGEATGTPATPVLSTASTTGNGGSIDIKGRNVVVDGQGDLARIDSSGAGKAGSVSIGATAVEGVANSGAIALGQNASLEANAASPVGDGGKISVVAGKSLRAYGSLSARGGAAGGNGGFIETSAQNFEMRGVRVDASAPMGAAGTWLIDPFDVTIAHGTGGTPLPTNPFVPLGTSTIQDGDINAALDKGTSVTITTGIAGTDQGNINFDSGVVIERTVGAAPVTFRLDANNAIGQNAPVCPSIPCVFAPTIIRSATGPLDVVFNANGAGSSFVTSILFSGQILTNGGNVTMNAAGDGSGNPAIALNNTTIDTRTTALGDAGPGGFVQITGKRTLPFFTSTDATVEFNGVDIQTATGDVSVSGTGPQGAGVLIGDGTAMTSQVRTTGGDVRIVGVGGPVSTSFGTVTVQGVEINNALVRTVDGDIDIRGLATAGKAGDTSGGVLIANNALVTTLGAGNIDITGESQSGGAGVTIAGIIPPGPFGGVAQPAARVDGNRNVVLRASNGGAVDALVIDGTVRAGSVLGLRPGGVDAAGNASDRTANPITLGGTAATGFAVSAAEFTRLDAPNIVAGSNAHAADINVVAPLTVSSALTLQNEGGGNIYLGGAVTAPKLGLLSRGNITQASDAAIVAGTLMARSTGGSVLLDQAANNVSAATVGGGAAGAFRYVDVDTVQLGSVSVVGYDAAGNAPQVVSATSMAADTVFVRTLSGDLLLGTNVSSTNGTDLVAASRFQNLGAYSIGGAPWRVWADTWVGETRGGLLGSGLYPNLYHCAYAGLCSVGIPAGANHFIYAQQPTATVIVGNVSRPFGYPNPLFSYGIAGLILGDTGAGFFGSLASPAVPSSPQGLYPISGSFISAEGYAVNVIPGNLLVTGLPNLPRPDALREMPSTWLYDRNMGPPPICFATGPLEGDRAAQGGDVLAREWSRVRSRPNLSSCVDTEKRNGCADF